VDLIAIEPCDVADGAGAERFRDDGIAARPSAHIAIAAGGSSTKLRLKILRRSFPRLRLQHLRSAAGESKLRKPTRFGVSGCRQMK
jgi:hypothetical protein